MAAQQQGPQFLPSADNVVVGWLVMDLTFLAVSAGMCARARTLNTAASGNAIRNEKWISNPIANQYSRLLGTRCACTPKRTTYQMENGNSWNGYF